MSWSVSSRMENRLSTLARLSLPALAALALASCAPSDDRVLVTVGEDRITAAEFTSAAEREPSYLVDPTPDGKEIFLEQLIDRSLLLGEARRRGYDQGAAFAHEVEEARGVAMSDALFGQIVSSRVWVSEAEIRELWGLRDREWRLSQIFTYDRRMADSFVRRLEDGEPFEQVARSGVVEPGTRLPGGDLGYLTGGDMPGPVERVVRHLEVGRWAGPLEDQLGHYIVQVTDIRARERAPYEMEREALATALRVRKERALAVAFVRSLKERYHLRHVPETYAVLARKWQNRSAEDLLAYGASLDGLGFTPEEQAMAVVAYDGGAYTVSQFFDDMLRSSSANRPPMHFDPLVRLYVEDRVMGELLRLEGERMQLDADPAVTRAVEERGESFLINTLYEGVIVPEAAARYQASPADPDSPVDGDAEQRFSEFRGVVLEEMLTRLRSEYSPVIDRAALARQPWPVANQETL